MKILSLDTLLPAALILAGAFGWYYNEKQKEADLPGLEGPMEVTVLPEPGDFTLDMAAFPRHGTTALAIYVNDPDSSWYGLASGLNGIGVPYTLYTDVNEALKHKVVMVYPMISGANTAPEDLQALADHVQQGGTLMGFAVLGGLMQIFGFESAVEQPMHRELVFTAEEFNAPFASEEVESTIYLGAVNQPATGLPGIAYTNPRNPPLATYEDGSPAITHNAFESESGTGHAYAFGIDIGHFILRAHNGGFADHADTYVNAYQPKIDTLLRFIAAVYRQGEPEAITLSPTPQGKDVAILMTHDIDFTESIVNAPLYAEAERAQDVPATYFIQTKYIKDYSDEFFFDEPRSAYVRILTELGMEVGSHSVAHSRVFEDLEAGTGDERYPRYHPFVESFRFVRGASVAGELRVSKYLLEALTPAHVQSFRPGHLSHPDMLPQMLSATGYRYSSSMTANEALTHLPYRPMYDRLYAVPVNDVYEFPVTIEDEEGVLGERTDAAIDVARKVARYHGLVNVLVHTDILDHKLDFTKKFIAAFRDSAWFGTVQQYGEWWNARDTLALDVDATKPAERIVHLEVAEPIDGLTLEVPAGWEYVRGVEDSRQEGSLISVGPLTGNAELEFRVQTSSTASD